MPYLVQNFFFLVITTLLVYYIVRYFIDRKRFGKADLLLENQVKWLRPFTIVFLAISITTLGLEIYYGQLTVFSLANNILLILFFAFFTLQQTLPLSLTPNGAYRLTQGFSWEEAQSYSFQRVEQRGKVYFILRMDLKMKRRNGKTRPYFFKYKLAAEMKKPTEQYLKQHIKTKKEKKKHTSPEVQAEKQEAL